MHDVESLKSFHGSIKGNKLSTFQYLEQRRLPLRH